MPKRSRKVSPRKVASKKSRRLRLKNKQQSNPFNRIIAKNLHNAVLGQKVKGTVKRPGHSISRSIEKRKETLLKEYNAIESNKHNTFIDKRYTKTLETKLSKLKNKKAYRDQKQIEKIIKKLTSQRLKSNKKVSFNLDDDELIANEFTLTHLGAPINDQVIASSNRGVDIDLDDEENDNKYLYKGFNKSNIYCMIKEKGMSLEDIAESAGVSLNKYENKTKPQIIKEQILRSRYKKCLQQIETQGIMDETDAVDHKLKESADWIFAHKANKRNTSDHEDKNIRNSIKQKKLDLEYQQKLIEFEKDERSGVTDRAITDAQKAQKNYQVLCGMEEKRKRKQLGLPSDSDNDEDIEDEDTHGIDDDEDANMERLEQMFDKAQKGYSDDEGEGKNVDIMDGQRDTNWDTLLEEIAQEDDDDDDDDGDSDGDGVFDNDEEYGYDADIDKQFIRNTKRSLDWNGMEEEEIEIGGEPAGKDEENVFEIMNKKERNKKREEGEKKLSLVRAATTDFDSEKRKKGRKKHNLNMNDSIDWNVLDLDETEGLVDTSIPFTLKIPSCVDEFEALMCGKSPSQQILLLKRMRCANHVKLAENNKSEIIRLYDMLLDYFRKLCTLYAPTKTNANVIGALQNDIGFYQYIDVITRALFALSHDIPEYAYSTHIKKLETMSMHIHCHYNVKKGKQYELKRDNTSSLMPSGYALFYLRLVSHIFPSQNKANPVISSVLLILCKIITDINICGARDVCCYIFCITLILEIIKKEKRYVPEVIHSLYNLLRAGFLSPNELKKSSFDLLRETDDLYFTFGGDCNIWNDLPLAGRKAEIEQISLPMRWIFLHNNNESILNTKRFKIQTLYCTLTLVFKCNEIWSSLLAYSQIFCRFYVFLNSKEIGQRICASNCILSDLYHNVQKCLKEGMETQALTRKPLQLIHRARAIPSLEPDFDPDMKPSFLRLKVRNVTALEKKKKRILKKAIKKQQKAVMNEFRKDTQFIMNEKTKNRIEADHKRQAKWEHEWYHLTEQQRDTNAFQMVGKKLKKKLMKKGVIRGF